MMQYAWMYKGTVSTIRNENNLIIGCRPIQFVTTGDADNCIAALRKTPLASSPACRVQTEPLSN